MWLLVGVQPDEVPSDFMHEYKTLDIENADVCGEIFTTGTWVGILQRYGEGYFDAIMTDGGLMYVRRNTSIVEIKHKLLKPNGLVYNYSSVIGERVNDPLGRGHVFYRIPKRLYTVEEHDAAWNMYPCKSWSDQLRRRMKLII